MKRITARFLPVFCLVCLCMSTCAAGKTLIFAAEEYWWETLTQTPDFQKRLQDLCRAAGYQPQILVIQKNRNYQEDLRQAIIAGGVGKGGGIVVTSPLLIPEVMRLSTQFPDVKFLVLGAPVIDGEWPRNVMPLAQGNMQGYYEAGRAAGRLLSLQQPQLYGRKVGAVETGIGRAEKEAVSEFERGFSQEASPSLLVSEDIGDSTDKVKAVQAVDDLWAQEVRVFFIKAPLSAAACAEKIAGMGGYFIMEDYAAYGYARDRLVGSVESDFLAGLSSGISRSPLWGKDPVAQADTGPDLLPVIPAVFSPGPGFVDILKK